tara:strand:- start:313 stop:477 length:165 start_codon:yes stop_codon:yes gene_type:complete
VRSAPEWKSEVVKRSALAPKCESEASAKSTLAKPTYPQVIPKSPAGIPPATLVL